MWDVLPVWIQEKLANVVYYQSTNRMPHHLDLRLIQQLLEVGVRLCVKIGLCNELFGKQQE